MGCRGVHFAIDNDMMERLIAADDDALIEIIQEEIEEEWDEEWLCETDKAWDAIHRCLTDGHLGWSNGSFPLNAVILGGERLHDGDEYIVCLVRPDKIPVIAEALKKVTEEDFRKDYFALPPNEYDAEINEDDFGYTWENLQSLIPLFAKASQAGKAIIFTVDQ